MADNNIKNYTISDSYSQFNVVKNIDVYNENEVKTLSDLDNSISELANLVEKLKKKSKNIVEK